MSPTGRGVFVERFLGPVVCLIRAVATRFHEESKIDERRCSEDPTVRRGSETLKGDLIVMLRTPVLHKENEPKALL